MQTTKYLQAFCMAAALAFSSAAMADDDKDVEGTIQSVNAGESSFVVNGQTFYADDRTDYDDELNSFADLKEGQRVEVDYVVRDGRNIVKEVEIDD